MTSKEWEAAGQRTSTVILFGENMFSLVLAVSICEFASLGILSVLLF